MNLSHSARSHLPGKVMQGPREGPALFQRHLQPRPLKRAGVTGVLAVIQPWAGHTPPAAQFSAFARGSTMGSCGRVCSRGLGFSTAPAHAGATGVGTRWAVTTTCHLTSRRASRWGAWGRAALWTHPQDPGVFWSGCWSLPRWKAPKMPVSPYSGI